jgi:hypothetical protein
VTLEGKLAQHQSIGIDTSPFIYHIEGGSEFSSQASLVLQRLFDGQLSGATSVLTLTEVLVKPYQTGGFNAAAH